MTAVARTLTRAEIPQAGTRSRPWMRLLPNVPEVSFALN
jgi:hypothetical protein